LSEIRRTTDLLNVDEIDETPDEDGNYTVKFVEPESAK